MTQQTDHVPDVRKKGVTAVEWLINEIKERHFVGVHLWKETIEQAKAIEKQQIIEAAERWKGTDFAEQYYKDTYGK